MGIVKFFFMTFLLSKSANYLHPYIAPFLPSVEFHFNPFNASQIESFIPPFFLPYLPPAIYTPAISASPVATTPSIRPAGKFYKTPDRDQQLSLDSNRPANHHRNQPSSQCQSARLTKFWETVADMFIGCRLCAAFCAGAFAGLMLSLFMVFALVKISHM